MSGAAGAWAGCLGLSALASPTLVLPMVGAFTTGTACMIGGIAGGLGAGWVGGLIGEWGGEGAYDFATTIQWQP